MDNSVVIGPLHVINCFWPLGMPPSVQSYPFYLCKQVYIVPLINNNIGIHCSFTSNICPHRQLSCLFVFSFPYYLL